MPGHTPLQVYIINILYAMITLQAARRASRARGSQLPSLCEMLGVENDMESVTRGVHHAAASLHVEELAIDKHFAT